jgi:hypothetical protein
MASGGLRWHYAIHDVSAGSEAIKIATVTRDDKNWERMLTFPNLEELTLHRPSPQQLTALSGLTSLKRLRICSANVKDIGFLSPLTNLRELVLEYVSGFSDLAPLRLLQQLRSLCLENLRGVTDFEGLSGLGSLVYLDISGTLDWNQPVADFRFLTGLPELEVLTLSFIVNKAAFPALLPMLSLKRLKHIRVGSATFSTPEYALLEVGLPRVAGASALPSRRRAYRRLPLPPDDARSFLPDAVIRADHPAVRIASTGERTIDDPDSCHYDLLGKGVRSIRCSSPQAEQKRIAFEMLYETLKEDARKLLASALD